MSKNDVTALESDKKELTDRQHAAVEALLSAPSVTKAAEGLKVTSRTLYRWLETEEFEDAIAEARRQRIRHASNRLQALAAKAIAALDEMLEPNNAPTVRIQAIKTAVNFAFKAYELDDLTQRIDVLEEQSDGNRRY